PRRDMIGSPLEDRSGASTPFERIRPCSAPTQWTAPSGRPNQVPTDHPSKSRLPIPAWSERSVGDYPPSLIPTRTSDDRHASLLRLVHRRRRREISATPIPSSATLAGSG